MKLIKNKNKAIMFISLILITVTILTIIFVVIFKKSDEKNINELPLQNIEEMTFNDNGIPSKTIKTNLWEKNFEQLLTQDVVIDKDWDKYIQIGSDFLMSDSFIDISELHNYFIKENDDPFPAEECYLTNLKEYMLASNSTEDVQFAISKLTVTTILHNKNAFIKSVEFQSSLNISEGGLDNLKKQKQIDGKFGLGSTYANIKPILLNEVKLFEDVQDAYITTFYSYNSEHAQMELRFARLKTDDIENAILVGIKWTPTTIADQLNK